MRFPEVLKQPSTFVAAALVTACLLALGAAIAGYAVVSGAAQTVSTVQPPSVPQTALHAGTH